MKRFAQVLGRYIEASGIKQTHVATNAHISYNYLQRLLAGDRHPSEQVVTKLAQALRLSSEQTGDLFAAAGYAPPTDLLQSSQELQQINDVPTSSDKDASQATRLTQQFYRLVQDVPDTLQAPFQEEMKHLLGYVRYKYLLSGGANLLELTQMVSSTDTSMRPDRTYLDLIAQLIGELHQEPESETSSLAEAHPHTSQVVEDMLSIIDRLTGTILTGEMVSGQYQPQLVVQMVELLQQGAPWEIRRRVAEALPGLCKFDPQGAEHLMETLRLDVDETRGVDIRRRVIEALPALLEASPAFLPTIVQLLRPQEKDDIYVALAAIEVCNDIQVMTKQLTEQQNFHAETQQEGMTYVGLTDIAGIQRQMLTFREGSERESLQFSLALHNLFCAPDTMLISLREGLHSSEKLLQLVAVRYLERLLPVRSVEVLELYQYVLHAATRRNVRRTVAKALPALLQCLNESSLPVRGLARSIVGELAIDTDIYIRRAVADHAMHVFSIDREFLLILLRQMHKDTDYVIRHRLQPVALRLAQVWLLWYAETAGLVETKQRRSQASSPFGD